MFDAGRPAGDHPGRDRPGDRPVTGWTQDAALWAAHISVDRRRRRVAPGEQCLGSPLSSRAFGHHVIEALPVVQAQRQQGGPLGAAGHSVEFRVAERAWFTVFFAICLGRHRSAPWEIWHGADAAGVTAFSCSHLSAARPSGSPATLPSDGSLVRPADCFAPRRLCGRCANESGTRRSNASQRARSQLSSPRTRGPVSQRVGNRTTLELRSTGWSAGACPRLDRGADQRQRRGCA